MCKALRDIFCFLVEKMMLIWENMSTFVVMKAKMILIACLLMHVLCAEAQVDSVNVLYGRNNKITLAVDAPITTREFNLNRLHHTFSLSLPIAAVGFAMMPADHPIRDRVMGGMPGFHTEVDNYIQYLPLATQLTMGLSGVKGRSKNRWQLLATDAMAAAMMAAMTNGLKFGVNRTRPNGGHRSFPSGHTATAFMGATLLAHEYGHRSVWFPIAGYSVATATGVLRILNNRHYASDVLVGAAIGIASAELAYWASDAIFNERKLFKSKRARIHYKVIENY